MQIRFLLTQSLESPSGGGRFLPLAKALARLGHQVKLIALHHDYETLGPHERAFITDGVRVEYVGQMHVRKVGNQKLYYHPLKLLWIAARATLALTLATLRDPGDAIHVCKTQPMNGLAAWVTHLLRRTPVYLDVDDWETLNNRFQNRWQQAVVSWFERWLPSFARGITANTTFIVEQFTELGYPPERIYLVPNSVDRARFAILDHPDLLETLVNLRHALHIEPHHRVVVYVGSMSLVNHALELLLEAWVRVAQAEPDALLVLVGGGEDFDILQQMAQDLGITNSVRFVGRVPMDEAPYYYRLGAFSVTPLRDSVVARTNLSLKLVESAFAGVPCLAGAIGDHASIIGDAAYTVPAGDVQAFADGILHLLHHPDQLAAMRSAALAMRDTLTWDRAAQRFVQVYAPPQAESATALSDQRVH